jgi:hypothetical protein
MESLKLSSGNRTGNQKGRPKKISINNLDESNRKVYHEIMEEIMEEYNIPKLIINY